MTLITEVPPVDAVGAPLALERMIVRLEALLETPTLTEEGLVEITAIYNNASYLLLYLDANDEHEMLGALKPLRAYLYEDPELDARILERLCATSFQDAEVEMARAAYVQQLREKMNGGTEASDATGRDPLIRAIERMRERMLSLEDQLAKDRHAVLGRIGLKSQGRDPTTLFYHLMARTEAATTRDKLARLWSHAGMSTHDKMVQAADALVAARREYAEAHGASSVLANTLKRCQIEENEAANFLDAYLRSALEHHSMLKEEIKETTGAQSDVMAHFGHFLHAQYGGETALLFDLDACLEFAAASVKAVFALDLERHSDKFGEVIVFEASHHGEPTGRINMEIWAGSASHRGANHTLGIRNRACWRDIVQLPEAWVKCHFTPRPEQPGQITFQNVHSVFHEFGHAVNHLLLEGRVPNQSGLEFMPLERLECLSMWFEKWVYHPDFVRHLGLTGDASRLARLSQAAKKAEYRRTYLERAVTAWLDFECHRRPNGGLREAFAELDARYGIADHVAVEDFANYFAWPMFMAHPGANFSYLWGAAWSCEAFEPFFEVCHDTASIIPATQGVFDPCLRASAPMKAPDPKAVFRFYAESSSPNTIGTS